MTSENTVEYGRLTPMLADIEALVRCESPSEDLDACRSVVALASDIALEHQQRLKKLKGAPSSGGAALHRKF
jgi:glutamate carboxypeptidase